jgi:catechol 2,3-dioxygenase-like lactoylglutathione lyase family enzyme
MKISGIHHCSIKVADMERATRFYREVLGLQEVEIPSTFPPAGIHVRWFVLGDEQIHLMPSDVPDQLSSRHFALHVEDARAAREHLKRQGVELQETTVIPGSDRFFIHDPDGNLIELIEWKEPYPNTPLNR